MFCLKLNKKNQKNFKKILGSGSLGSRNDEERSEIR